MTGDLDLRGNKLILPGEINMNRKLIKDLDTDETDDLLAVNMATLKKFYSLSSGDIHLQDKFNVKNSKPQSFQEMPTNYDNLISYEDAKKAFVSKKETFAMEADLDMGNHQIFNVKDPTVSDHGANKKYVDDEDAKHLPLSGGTMTGPINAEGQKITNLAAPTANADAATKKFVQDEVANHVLNPVLNGNLNMTLHKITNLGAPTANTDAATKKYVDDEDAKHLPLSGGTMAGDINASGNKITNLPSPTTTSEPTTKHYVDQSHLSQSGIQKNEFLYLMHDVNESSSESNITVLGIKKFPQTPHTINKNAKKFLMRKDAQNKYASRIGFNLYQRPAGPYTFVVEFFLQLKQT